MDWDKHNRNRLARKAGWRPGKRKVLKEEKLELPTADEQKKKYYIGLVKEGSRAGWHPKAALAKYRSRFGVWPKGEWTKEALEALSS